MIDTIKRSKKRSNWQIKDQKKHEIHHLSHFESIIRPCLREIGIDPNRKDIVVNMKYDDKEFNDYQVTLEFNKNTRLGPEYKIVDSKFGDYLVGLRGYPNSWMINKLGHAPEKIYLSFDA